MTDTNETGLLNAKSRRRKENKTSGRLRKAFDRERRRKTDRPEATLYRARNFAHSLRVSRWIAAAEKGILTEVDMPHSADARIRCTEILKQPGDFVRPPLENVDRIGYVMVCDYDKIEAERLADDFISRCRCHLRSAVPAMECSL